MMIYCKKKYDANSVYSSLFFLSLLLLVSVIPADALAEGRDPFSPTGSGNIIDKIMPNNSDNKSSNNSSSPLTSSKLSSFRVVGVISSKDKKIGVVKSINGLDYNVQTGDAIGSEGAIIADITVDGLVVENRGKKITLPVKNKIEINPEG